MISKKSSVVDFNAGHVTVCAHPFKAELFLQVFDTKNVYKFSIALFKKMKIDSRKQREERFLYIGLSVPHNAISIFNVYNFFT